MATDLEKLVVQLSMQTREFEKALARAHGVSNQQFNAIERRARQMNKNLDGILSRSFKGLTAPLTGIGAALGTREILRYADAWTSAKNSLSVAGVVGAEQKQTLDALYQSAQANAAPITALSDLYGKAAQASDNLGASQSELLQFSDGVAVALRVAGTSAGAASGALTQLGQLLGQARVQAEEFNSINEGARPILMAVANGLDAAGGSVSKLKQLVNDGKVSGQQFFQAFLKGLPSIQSMAANATQTIEQGITKVNNAFTKYIGETDESLGASQRLVAGLNALADNFDETADIVLKLASVIAGALVGRSVVSMIRGLGLATSGTLALISALRTASSLTGVVKAFGGLGAAAGPLGAVIGGTVVTALVLFTSNSDAAGVGADLFSQRLRKMGEEAEAAASKVQQASRKVGGEASFNAGKEVEYSVTAINEAKDAVDNLFDAWIQVQAMSLVTDEQRAELQRLKEGLDDGTVSAEEAKDAIFDMAKADYNFEEAANQFKPVLDTLALISAAAKQAKADMASLSGVNVTEGRNERASKDPYIQARNAGNAYLKEAQHRNSLTKEQLSLETEIARIKKDAEKSGIELTEQQIKAQAQANLAADARRSSEGRKPRKERKTPEQDFSEDLQSITDRTAALIAETEAQRQINPLIDDYGYAIEKARAEQDLLNAAQKAGVTITPELRAQIAATAEQFALATQEAGKLAEAQDKIRQNAEDMVNFQKDLTRGIVDGFIQGKKAADIFADALSNIGNRLLDLAFDGLFDSKSGGGGLLGSLFGGLLGRKDGGPIPALANGGAVRGPGGPRDDKVLMWGSNGEFMMNAKATKQFRPILEAMNKGRMPALKDGGGVGAMPALTAPRMPILKAPVASKSSQRSSKMDINVNVSGARGNSEIQQMVADGVSQGLQQYDREMLPQRFRQIARDPYAVG